MDNKRLWAIGDAPVQDEPASGSEAAIEDAPDHEDAVPWDTAEEYGETAPREARLGWLLPTIAVLAVLAWSGFFAWAHSSAFLTGGTPQAWSRLIVDWSVPVLLVVALWLLAMRNSRREAARFGFAAQALASEAHNLELRLTTVNRELSLAREFIAAQSRDLELLGRVAAERLSQNADRLQGLIRDNGEQVEQIGRISGTALANMDRLRDDLPVISNSARDMTNQIGQAGAIAQSRLEELTAGFAQLTEASDVSSNRVADVRGRVEAALAAFDAQSAQLESALGHRFAALTERSAAFRAEVDGREVEAFAALRRRSDALGQEMATSAEQLARLEREALAALTERSAAFQIELEGRESESFAALRRRADALAQEIAAASDQLARHERDALASLAERSGAVQAEFDERGAQTLAAMRERADALTHEIATGTAELERLEREALAALGARMGEVNAEATRISAQLRDGEHEASERWLAGIAGLEERMADAVHRIAEIDAHAAENARNRLIALREEAIRVDDTMAGRLAAFNEQRERRDAEAAERETAALSALEQRLAEFDAQVGERQQEQVAHVAGLTERSEALAARLRELSAEMDELVMQGHETQGDLTLATDAFAARVAESRASLTESGTIVARLTDDSVRLLELIRAGADHTSGDLPAAIGQAEARLATFEVQARSLSTVIAEAGERGATLAAHVASARGDGAATLEELAALDARLREVAGQTEALAARAQHELSAAVNTLGDASRAALGNLQDSQADAIRAVANRIGTDTSAAIASALREHAVQAVAELEGAARQAGEAGRQTAMQLRDQLVRVNELAGNLEQRIAQARERAEEQVDNDFARRMALITESLNSNAIDISKAFANEVTDTAWASYLRGDRGIFTRRTVRLLDTQDARAVAEIYSGDSDFRETVNRYIHDFEAMLRSVLSTRDGHAMAVTLLSSDMGKLYVALAQAIERLRT